MAGRMWQNRNLPPFFLRSPETVDDGGDFHPPAARQRRCSRAKH
jgi:hypothetical protein